MATLDLHLPRIRESYNECAFYWAERSYNAQPLWWKIQLLHPVTRKKAVYLKSLSYSRFSRFTLFDPKYFGALYPYPVGHAADRQSQVDLYNPDLTKFPKFSEAVGLQTILNPGDVLYLPEYWWHHVESPFEDTISLSFWFTPRPELVSVSETLLRHLRCRFKLVCNKSHLQTKFWKLCYGEAQKNFLERNVAGRKPLWYLKLWIALVTIHR